MGFIDNSHLDKIVTLASTMELKSKQDKIAELQAFEDDGTQKLFSVSPSLWIF